MEQLNDILKRVRQAKKKKIQATYHQQLATEIAEAFGDIKHIGMYMKVCKTFDTGFVKNVFDYVKSKRDVKNQGAYFMTMVKQMSIQYARNLEQQ